MPHLGKGNVGISIHALLAESDDNLTQGVFNLFTFLSTLSLRRATFDDLQVPASVSFLSTLSLRRATILPFVKHLLLKISIHALLAESDAYRVQLGSMVSISIHALLAESDPADLQIRVALDISIHALLAESDSEINTRGSKKMISIHALLAESDLE